MKKNILVVGNFGFSSGNLNGQTMRTRTVFEGLSKYTPESYTLKYIDTSESETFWNKILNVLKLIFLTIKSNIYVLMPAQKAIKYMLPIYSWLNAFLNKKLYLIAIGGWLADFLEVNEKYVKYLVQFDSIFVQTVSLKEKLEKMGISNVVYFPNFRLYPAKNISLNPVTEINEIVFFSRVTPEKGIELAISSINEINKKYNKKIELHVFGPIENQYKNNFFEIVQDNKNVIYKGVLNPDEILNVLSNYNLMVFPTYYPGEGFPGAILDALTAGVPIIASDWKYNSEVIKDGYTGLLFETNNQSELTEKIESLIKNIELVNQMKLNCLTESKKYEGTQVMPILIDKIL